MESMLKSGNRHIKIGLIIGAIGFFVVVFFTFGGSFCGGLFCSIGMGAIAGLLTSRYANVGTKENASKLGSISGGIAGVFALLGQILGGMLPSGIVAIFGALGTFSENSIEMIHNLFSMSFMPSVLNGIIGLVAAGIAGSIAAAKGFDT